MEHFTGDSQHRPEFLDSFFGERNDESSRLIVHPLSSVRVTIGSRVESGADRHSVESHKQFVIQLLPGFRGVQFPVAEDCITLNGDEEGALFPGIGHLDSRFMGIPSRGESNPSRHDENVALQYDSQTELHEYLTTGQLQILLPDDESSNSSR